MSCASETGAHPDARARGPATGGHARTGARRRGPSADTGRRPRTGGFSLFEVMVAMVLLAVGALAVARSMGTALSSGTRAGEQTRATALAVERLEYLKSRPASTVDDEPARRIDARGRPDPDGAYRREVSVRDASEGARPNTREVTVTVEFTAGEAGRQEVEMFTVLFVNDT